MVAIDPVIQSMVNFTFLWQNQVIETLARIESKQDYLIPKPFTRFFPRYSGQESMVLVVRSLMKERMTV